MKACRTLAIWQYTAYTLNVSPLLDTLRQAILDAGESRNRIAQGSSVAASQLCRLISGERGLSIESAERLAEYLRLEIVVRPKQSRKKR